VAGIECVANISEGREPTTIELIAAAAGDELLDVHRDADHHRSVLTLVGEDSARAVTTAAVATLDLRGHRGAHPRIGVVDVVPFVPLGTTPFDHAIAARERFMGWAATELSVPCFRYGPERSLPEVRRRGFRDLAPDAGPDQPHPTAGAIAVGARPPLVAYNLWLRSTDVEVARLVAASLRGRHVRALGLQVGDAVQVSMNLIEPLVVGPLDVYRAVGEQVAIDHAELVGLVPAAVLAAVSRSEWSRLDLSEDQSIEARMSERGFVID
jgi:glutamate formiminotransferase / 5-formyltetrahydrofolate cyclo-ligase